MPKKNNTKEPPPNQPSETNIPLEDIVDDSTTDAEKTKTDTTSNVTSGIAQEKNKENAPSSQTSNKNPPPRRNSFNLVDSITVWYHHHDREVRWFGISALVVLGILFTLLCIGGLITLIVVIVDSIHYVDLNEFGIVYNRYLTTSTLYKYESLILYS